MKGNYIYNNNKIIDKNLIYYDNPKIYKIKGGYDDYNNIVNYGNAFDVALSSLTVSEVEKLRKLVTFLGGSVLTSVNDVISLITIIKDPRYAQSINTLLNFSNANPTLYASPTNLRDTLNQFLSTRSTTSSQNIAVPTNNTSSPAPATITQSPIIQVDDSKKDDLPQEQKPQASKNPLIDIFMNDILDKSSNPNFRGWMLPNGQLLSQYDDIKASNGTGRQDHSKLVKIFLNGLKAFDLSAYDKMMSLYDDYIRKQGITKADLDESFAVEVLGWIQIAHFGRKNIVYRAERWQDAIIAPFLVDYGFRYTVNDFGRSYEREFAIYYDHIDEIIELGLENKYLPTM